jgi:CPA2 family monovalent cation:H+ antiporter-2
VSATLLHNTDLVTTLTAGLVVAFAFGLVAQRLRLPPIVGYLLAGIAIGPFTPGFEGDTEIAPQLAEIGVVLLMFGVGIHFSVKDLVSVSPVALPGAVAQTATATMITIVLTMLWGWSFGEGLVLGLAISVASTVVLLRALETRGSLTASEGRIAVGWLIVEDLFTVLVLVLLPAAAPSLGGDVPEGIAGSGDNPGVAFLTAIAKVLALGLLMVVVASRVIPWLLLHVARTGSRELFTLSILATALGIAYASAEIFDVSLALGAFLAGLVVAQSAQSHQAAADALPFRDAFAVLFFVSVGMLFDPAIVKDEPAQLVALLAVIFVGKSMVAATLVLAFAYPLRVALVVAAGLAQIGEFSFILAEMGRSLDLLSEDGNNLILAAALASISLNPLIFRSIDPIERWILRTPSVSQFLPDARRMHKLQVASRGLQDHAVIAGYGNVGYVVGRALTRLGIPFVVVEQSQRRIEEVRHEGVQALFGDASNIAVLEQLRLSEARLFVAATADAAANEQMARRVLKVNPNLDIVVRTRTLGERDAVRAHDVREIVVGDVELALTIVRRSAALLGFEEEVGRETIRQLRHDLETEHDIRQDAPADSRRGSAHMSHGG